MRQRFVLARLGGNPAEVFGRSRLSEFTFAGQAEFGRIMSAHYGDAPERVWLGHSRERGYFHALLEAGLECEHPLPMRRPYGSGWLCLACDVAFARAVSPANDASER
jgi:hypothetical protein